MSQIEMRTSAFKMIVVQSSKVNFCIDCPFIYTPLVSSDALGVIFVIVLSGVVVLADMWWDIFGFEVSLIKKKRVDTE